MGFGELSPRLVHIPSLRIYDSIGGVEISFSKAEMTALNDVLEALFLLLQNRYLMRLGGCINDS
jgi:hypothetical protein